MVCLGFGEIDLTSHLMKLSVIFYYLGVLELKK